MVKKRTLIIALFLTASQIYSQPVAQDYLFGYGTIALVTASELFKDHLAPSQANWKETNEFDLFFRKHLKWQNKNLNSAVLLSDIIAKGIFIPSVLWSPLMADHNYGRHLLLNIQVIAATGLILNSAKFISARQRPYSVFNSLPAKGTDDYLSFFSGHTAFPFAISTSGSLIMEKVYPHQSAFFWSGSIILSALSGYLRIAADHHYMSDVIAGALVGSVTGYLITRQQMKKFFQGTSKPEMNLINFSISL